MKFIHYIIHLIVEGMVFLIKLLMSVGISPKLFKEIIASHSVGKGQNEYNKKNYDKAYQILKPIADYNFSDGYVGIAQMFIGLMYFYGNGIEQDTEISRKYLSKAIENHNDYAKKFIKNLPANSEQ